MNQNQKEINNLEDAQYLILKLLAQINPNHCTGLELLGHRQLTRVHNYLATRQYGLILGKEQL